MAKKSFIHRWLRSTVVGVCLGLLPMMVYAEARQIHWWHAMGFSFAVAVIALSVALYLAVQADRVARGATTYQTLLLWPYAVALRWPDSYGICYSTL